MSKTYGEAVRVSGNDRVTYTPQAAIIEVAASGGFSEHDIMDVRDLLLVGLARQCGGTCWQPDHSNPGYASLLSPAGYRGWNIDGTWHVELHVESNVELHPVDPDWPPHEELWVRLDGSWRGACRDAVDSRRRRISESGRLPAPR